MVKALSPDDVAEQKLKDIPPEVMEAWNKVIAKHYVGRESSFGQEEIISEIMVATQVDRAQVFKRHWLDIEEIYRQAGWHVNYDKPAYCETYEANFTFTKKKTRE